MKHYLTIAMCFMVWFTIVFARTNAFNEVTIERGFAIGGAALAMLILGMAVQKLIHEHDDKD